MLVGGSCLSGKWWDRMSVGGCCVVRSFDSGDAPCQLVGPACQVSGGIRMSVGGCCVVRSFDLSSRWWDPHVGSVGPTGQFNGGTWSQFIGGSSMLVW